MSEMTKPDSRVIDFSFYQKKKFYNKFIDNFKQIYLILKKVMLDKFIQKNRE